MFISCRFNYLLSIVFQWAFFFLIVVTCFVENLHGPMKEDRSYEQDHPLRKQQYQESSKVVQIKTAMVRNIIAGFHVN